jgi:molybdenum cofactor guanylyltransferase
LRSPRPSTSRIRFSACAGATFAAHLGAFLAGGGRKIDRWYGTLKVVEVSFDDEEAAFRNINTRDELVEAAKDLPRTNHG